MARGSTLLSVLFASGSLLALSSGAAAQENAAVADASERQDYAIPAESLDRALTRFAEISGANLLYSADLVAGRRSSAVNGSFTAQDALSRLLAGSGLRASVVSPNVFSLQSGDYSIRSGDQTAAEAGPITGVLRDANSGGTLPGAQVRVIGSDLVAVTDESGAFYIPDVPASAGEVRVTYLGQPAQSFPIPDTAFLKQRMNLMLGSAQDRIVVLGYQSSLQRALNQQLRAPNSATIISADLLGSFPAESLSEALRRVPGVAFGRNDDTGEGSRITVRGFSSEAINIQLNGLELQGTNFERTVDLSGFLADNIAQVTIHKSLLPSHESTGSGGLVEVETKSGLDYDGWTAQLGVEGEYSPDGGYGGEYQINGLISARIADNFGVVATAQYRKTDRTNYNADIADSLPQVLPSGRTGVSTIPASQQFPFDPEFNSRLVTGVSYSTRQREEENLTASINFEWEASPSTTVRLDLQRIQRDAYSETARTTASFLTSGQEMPIPELGGEVRRRTTIASLRPNLGFNVTDLHTYQNTISLRGTTNLDRWKFEYKAGYQNAKSRSNNSNISALGATNTNVAALISPDTIVFNPDDDAAMTQRVVDGAVVFQPNGLPVLSLSQAGLDYLNNSANYTMTSANRTLTDSPTEAFTLEGSARYQPAPSWFDYIELGGKWDRSVRKANDDVFASTSSGSLLSVEAYQQIFARQTTLDNFGTNLFDSNTLGAIGAGNFRAPFLTLAGSNAIFDLLPSLLVDDPATAFNENRYTFVDRRALDPILDSGGLSPARTVEERGAGYVQTGFTFGPVELVGGFRYETVYRSGQTISTPSVRTAGNVVEPRDTFITAGLVQFTDLSGRQNVLTPSMIANFRPMDNLVARFAYFKSTVNPDFRLIRRARSVNIDLRSTVNRALLTEANPDLRPTKTDNFDVDFSYYFTDSPGLVRVGFFYKKVKNNFTNVLFLAGPDDDVRGEILDYFGDLATSRPDLVAFDANTEFLRNRPENGAGGKIYGVELEAIRQLTFLPGLLSNFTILGNLTWTKGDFPTEVSGRDDAGVLTRFTLNRPLEDQAEWVYNLSLSYEDNGFEGRVIYTYQSATPSVFEVHGLDAALPEYDTLDVRLSYSFDRIGTNWTIYLQGDDLLRSKNDVDLRRAITSEFTGGGDSYYFPDIYQFNGGRTVTAGIRARF